MQIGKTDLTHLSMVIPIAEYKTHIGKLMKNKYRTYPILASCHCWSPDQQLSHHKQLYSYTNAYNNLRHVGQAINMGEKNKTTQTSSNMTIKDSNITIMVKDMERSISFYQSIGLTVKNRWANHYAQLTAPGVVIGLHPTSDNNLAGGSGNASIGFTTDNFEEAKTLLNSLSVPVMPREEEGGQFLHFTDPDGTSLYFVQPKWN